MNQEELKSLEKFAFNIRKHIINTIITNGEGHAGPALSCTDIIAVLYKKIMNVDETNPNWDKRDRFLLSAGHKCLAFYGALVERGFISKDVLRTYNMLNSLVPGHPDMKKISGVDFNTGSLGHGLSIGSGMALAAKLNGDNYKTYVLMGDGEQGEGSVWEAACFAAHKNLDNLVAIIDRNGLQINGATVKVLKTESLVEKYTSFGWEAREINGHDLTEIYDALCAVPFVKNKPSIVIANTIKGKGLSFAENNYKYHHWHPDQIEQELAMKELALIEERLTNGKDA